MPGLDPDTPLFVTRPAHDATSLVDALRARGRPVVAMPVISIEPVDDPAALSATMARLDDYRLVVFVSPNAIRQALAQRAGPWPPEVAIGVMGPGSVDVLRQSGIDAPRVRVLSPGASGVPADPASARFDSEALFTALDGAFGLATGFDGRVLILRGNGGRAWLAERLRGLGIAVDEVEAYRRVRPDADAVARDALHALFAGRRDAAFIVTSSEGIDHLVAIVVDALARVAAVTERDARAWLFGCAVVAPHRRIAEKARDAGFSRVSLCAPGDRGILATIE